MNSRFFAGSDSDTSSDDELELLADVIKTQQGPTTSAATSAANNKNVPLWEYLRRPGEPETDAESDASSDSDGSDASSAAIAGRKSSKANRHKNLTAHGGAQAGDRKRVKSARETRVDRLGEMSKNIQSSIGINDWREMTGQWDDFMRQVDRLDKLGDPLPLVYFDTLCAIEKAIEAKKSEKMSLVNQKNLSAVRQKYKKLLVSTEDWTALVSWIERAPEKNVKGQLKYLLDLNDSRPEVMAEIDAVLSADKIQDAPSKGTPQLATATLDDGEGFEEVGKGGKVVHVGADGLLKELAAIAEMRGRKNTDRVEAVRRLERLLTVAQTPYQTIKTLLALVSARFDAHASSVAFMPVEPWRVLHADITQLLNILDKHRDYVVIENITTTQADQDDGLNERAPNADEPQVQIRASLMAFVDRLDEEYYKSLQNIDPHTSEYISRLKDEQPLYATIINTESYYATLAGSAALAKVASEGLSRVTYKRLEHVYSKPDFVLQAQETYAKQHALFTRPQPPMDSLVHSLCVQLYKSQDPMMRIKTMLAHMYHHALHGRFHDARDMLLMSRLQESIGQADVNIQIMYNRTIVQLGLCAFRKGLIKESQAALSEIYATGRVKELLAQGTSLGQRYVTPEQERLEKSRELPFHMHINFELLEAAFLTACMLIDIPAMAQAGSDQEQRKRIANKYFKRQYDFHERQAFTGPPESTRDHIMQAAKAMQTGDWASATHLISSVKIWTLLPDCKTVLAMLADRIKKEALRTYLFTFCRFYENVSISLLATSFDMPKSKVMPLISKMIWHEELAASIDQSHDVVAFSQEEAQPLQVLAQTLAEKAHALYESNERALENKLNEGDARISTENRQPNERTNTNTERRGRGGGARTGTLRGRGGRSGLTNYNFNALSNGKAIAA